MKKGFQTYLPIWAILFVLFSIISWAVPVDHDEVFYVVWGIGVAAMLVQLLISYTGLQSDLKEVKYPAVIFSTCGIVIVAIIGAVCVWLKAKTWIVVVADSIVLALNYITVLMNTARAKQRYETDRKFAKKG